MKYWMMKNNGRVGKHPSRPSDSWIEISYETYCKEYALEHDGKTPLEVSEAAPSAEAVCTCGGVGSVVLADGREYCNLCKKPRRP